MQVEFTVGDNGHMMFGGADTLELAARYGTPLYVYDEAAIRAACQSYTSSVNRFYDGHGRVLYASKAFSCKAMYRLAKEEGLGVDTVSGGEIYTALQSGFPAENIVFHGNNKTRAELEMAVSEDIGHIVIDDFDEIEALSQIAARQGKQVQVMLRVKPGIDAHTHDFIKTGQIDSKFGFTLERDEALLAVRQVLQTDSLILTGLHCHIGSQIFSVEPFCLAAEVMATFIARIREETGCMMHELNLGGGFGIRYTEQDDPLPYESYMQHVSGALKAACGELGIPVPYVYIEPGRSIVGPAGITLYTVGGIKPIPGVRTYVAVDGGMSDNPRYALYGAEYEAVIANRAGAEKNFTATIAGKCCESGDLIGENIKIQTPHTGDILAVLATGAYNYSMASNYNRLPRPAAVMVRNGEAHEIIRRESYDDLLRNDL